EVVGFDQNGKVTDPEKLWQVGIGGNDKTTKITLSPDGRFLYAVGRFTKDKSAFIAIDAQTGKQIQLLPGEVATSGKKVTWTSGMNFARTIVGQRIPIGSGKCTVKTTS